MTGMKRCFFGALSCLGCLVALAAGATAQETLTGLLYVTGSEPFTQVALRTTKGETLSLGWVKDHKDLLEHQGGAVRVVGQRGKGIEQDPLAPFEATTVVPLNLEGDVVMIQVQVHPNPDPRFSELSTVIRPMKMGRWYESLEEEAISSGMVGFMIYELNRMKATRSRPDLSPLIMQPYTDLSIHYLDGSTDRLQGGVASNGSSVWRLYAGPNQPTKTLISVDFTRAFLEVMKDADPKGWKPVFEAFLREEQQP